MSLCGVASAPVLSHRRPEGPLTADTAYFIIRAKQLLWSLSLTGRLKLLHLSQKRVDLKSYWSYMRPQHSSREPYVARQHFKCAWSKLEVCSVKHTGGVRFSAKKLWSIPLIIFILITGWNDIFNVLDEIRYIIKIYFLKVAYIFLLEMNCFCGSLYFFWKVLICTSISQ